MFDSFDRKSRQERTRDFLNQFEKGNLPTSSLTMKLYPSELDRFKEEFPNLDFNVTKTIKSASKKMFEVRITEKSK